MHKILLFTILILFFYFPVKAQDKPRVQVSTDVSVGGGENNPFWLVSNRHGLSSLDPNNGYVRGAVMKDLNRTKKFVYAYGVDLAGAWNNTSSFIIQQLYGEIKYRSLFLSVGSKERIGEFSNPDLSSGDVTISGNARPIPQVRAGFNRWVSPFRSCKWFALKGEIAYGWFTDKHFQEKQVNKQYGLMSTGVKYHHKAIYFKFGNEQKHPWLVEAGYVLDSEFGGKSTWYKNGQIDRVEDAPDGAKEYIKAFFPVQGSSTYYEGNYVGGWQIKLSYKIHEDHKLRIGMENIFDDASSMGKLNGFDGLWSLEYNTAKKGLITSALFEYF
ncbi:MAG: capsule assembly Wzi family protein, partial [Bacteroidales bacterium]